MVEIKKREPEQPKRGKWKKDVPVWRRRIALAEKKLQEAGGDVSGMGGSGSWRSTVEFYQGGQWGGRRTPFGQEKVTVNLVKSSIDAIRPQLYFKNPKVSITVRNPDVAVMDIPRRFTNPETGAVEPVIDPATGQPEILFPRGTPMVYTKSRGYIDAGEQAEILKAIDEWALEEMNFTATTRRVINDALVLPYGVSKVGIEYLTEDQEQPPEDISDIEELGGVRKSEVREVTTRQRPFNERVKPWCFLFDPDLSELDLSKAKWVAEVKFLSLEDMEGDPQFSLPKNMPKATHVLDDGLDTEDMLGSSSVEESDMARWKVYEIHDLVGETIKFWIDGAETFSRNDPHPYAIAEGSVYSILAFDEAIDSPFPLSIAAGIRDKNELVNWVRSSQVSHISRFNRKYAVQKGTLEAKDMESLQSGADGTIVEIQGAPPEPIRDAPISSDLYRIADEVKRDITEEVGATAYQRGSREPGVDTAYEASLISGGSDVKTTEKRDKVGDYVRQCIRKLNQIFKVYLDQETLIQVVGSKGTRWEKFTREDIQGEYWEEVDIYSGLPNSKEVEKRQTLEMFSLLSNDPYVNPYELRSRVRKAFDAPEALIYTPEEFAQAQQQIVHKSSEQSQVEENAKAQAQQVRPEGAETQRASDIQGGILGGGLNVNRRPS